MLVLPASARRLLCLEFSGISLIHLYMYFLLVPQEGYKDTVAHARDAALQLGFGEGFVRGFALGLQQGHILGVCS
jgi:hypothetical protein